MKPYGIEPETFRFVAQHLNHCATAAWAYINKLKLMVAYRNFAKEPWKGGGEIWPPSTPDLNTCDFYLRVTLKAKLCSKIARTGDSFGFTNRHQSAVNVFVRWHVSAAPPTPSKKIFMAFFQDTLYEQRLLAWSCISLRVCPSTQEGNS